MKNIGILLTVFGTLYILLTLFGIDSSFVTWIDSWGESIGWSIRGGSLLIGVILYSVSLYLQSNHDLKASPDLQSNHKLEAEEA